MQSYFKGTQENLCECDIRHHRRLFNSKEDERKIVIFHAIQDTGRYKKRERQAVHRYGYRPAVSHMWKPNRYQR